MVGCSVYGCSTRSSKRSSRQRKLEEIGAISFHKFPQDPHLRQKWIEKLCRPDLVVTKNSTVCALHFEERFFIRKFKKTKLLPNAIPTIFPDYGSNIEQFIHQRGHSKGRLSIKMATGVAIIGEKPRRSTPLKARTPSSPAASGRMAEGRRTKLKRNFIPKRRPIVKNSSAAKTPEDPLALPLAKPTKTTSNKKSSPPHPRILQKPRYHPQTSAPDTKQEATNGEIQFNNGYPMRDYEEFERKYSAAMSSPTSIAVGAGPSAPVFADRPPQPAEIPDEQQHSETTYYESEPMTCEVDPMPADDTDSESEAHEDQTGGAAEMFDDGEASDRGDDDTEADDAADASSPRGKIRKNLQKLQKKRRRNLNRITKLRNALNKLTNDNLLIDDRIAMMINGMVYKCGI